MIDIKGKIAEELSGKAGSLSNDEIRQLIEIPADSSMGDYAFPCFRLAKEMRKAPQMIASDIAEQLSGTEIFEKVEAVGAYVNMFIDRPFFARELVGEVLKRGRDYGRSDIGKGKKVIVEFSSPNIAKPFHIGHIRSTVIGNALYKLYDATGYETVRINHLGDYGTQFGKMIVAYRRWGNEAELEKAPIKTLLKYYTRFHEEAEKDPSLNEEARKAFLALENGEKEEVELWERFRELSIKAFQKVYDMMGIKFDSYAGESFYSNKMPRFINELNDSGLLEESEGAQIVRLDDFDMPPALITKSDGSTLYVTRDIAAAVYRMEHYDFDKCIYVVASQQNLHFKQWKKVLELLGYEQQKNCIHVPFGLVSMEDGTMSTRHGRVVFLEDVLRKAVDKTAEIIKERGTDDEETEQIAKDVGIGAVIFQELSNNRIKDYVFSWDKVLNFDGETGPYVQYTHARASSVLRKASEEDLARLADPEKIDFSALSSDSAYALVKLLYRVPDVIIDATEKYEPSIVTRHLIDIAQSFNKFYHDEHILVEDDDERLAKLALVSASKTVIANCLDLLGIKAPERM